MNILLTGGTDFIGSHTAVELANVAQPSDHIILFDNLCNSEVATVDRIHQIVSDERGAAITFVEGDIRDTALLMQVIFYMILTSDTPISFKALPASSSLLATL